MTIMGRPPLYTTAEEMAQAIEDYFTWAEGEWKEKKQIAFIGGKETDVLDEFGDPIVIKKCIRPPETITICGLALYLGFNSRQGMMDSIKRGDDFSAILARGKALVEMDYEERLSIRDKAHGAQFALMNMGWAANTKYAQIGAGGEVVDPPKQVMIINGKEIQF